MKIAILTRPDNKSPKIMALSLQNSLIEQGNDCDIFYNIYALKRLIPLNKPLRAKTSFHFRVKQKISNYVKDKSFFNTLKKYDAIIISECIPNGFWRGQYALDKFKKTINKPLGFLEVFFLDAAPNHIKALKENGDYLQQAYDFHLALSKVSYIKTETSENKFQVGLNLKSQGLNRMKKKDFYILMDFRYPGNEELYKEQIQALKKANIPYKKLEGQYTIEEIRELYKNATAFVMQHYESFGLPIAECLSYGTKILTPDSSWPSAFRLENKPEYYKPGKLADCFKTFNNINEFITEVKSLQEGAKKDVSKDIFNSFVNNYPSFYYGNTQEIIRFINFLSSYEKN